MAGFTCGNATIVNPPAIVYMGLFTVAPSAANPAGVEVSGNGYARIAMHTNPIIVSAVVAPLAPWGTIVAHGLFTALTGGSLLMSYNLYGALSPVDITVGNMTWAPPVAIASATPS
jgi:acyl dehydratase